MREVKLLLENGFVINIEIIRYKYKNLDSKSDAYEKLWKGFP